MIQLSIKCIKMIQMKNTKYKNHSNNLKNGKQQNQLYKHQIKQKKKQKTRNLMNKIILLLFILPAILASNKQLCSIHCQICANSGTCIKCKQLYVLATNGDCLRDGVIGLGVEGCVGYDGVGEVRRCARCQEDRMLVKGKCIKLGKNCQLIDQFYQCIKCSAGHQLVGRQCLSTKINNCSLGQIPFKKYCRPYSQIGCSQTKQQSCTKCLKNYNLVHGICIPKSFKLILSTSLCKTIIPPKFCLIQSPIPHCLVSTSLFCQSCQAGYSLQKGQCLKSVKQDDPNCNVYDSKTQVCTGCNNDYQLDRNSLCVRNFPIRTCQSSMFFQAYQGNCFYKDRFCQRIQVNTHICVACMEGYVLRAGKCERQYKCAKFYNGLCEQCMPEFFLQPCSRSCSQKPRNCIKINRQNDQCIECTPSTQLSSLTLTRRPTCVRLEQKCIEYNNEGSCILCMSGFVQKNRKCYPRPANCQQLSQSDSTLCIKCYSGYKMVDSQCYEHIQGCIKYSRNGSCFACGSRFVKYNGQCFQVDHMCLTYDQDGMCVGCRDGLLPARNRCVFYQIFCQSYGQDRVCNSSYDKWFNLSSQILPEETKNSYKQFVISSSKVQSPFSQRPQVTQRQTSDKKGYYQKYGIITFPPTLTVTKSSIKLLKSTLEIISCKQGFQLFSPNPQHSSCIPVEKWSQFCKSYNPSTFDCVICQKGYDMNSDGKCEKRSGKSCGDRIIKQENCGRCNVRNGYYNVGGWCLHRGIERSGNAYIQLVDLKVRWPLLANCLMQTSMNQCEQCALGYTKIEGRCVAYQKYCEVYHTLGFCFKCRAGYVKYGQNCIPLNCPNSYSHCSNCLNPYTYRSGHCILQNLPNCLIPSAQLISQCLLCQPQFYLSSWPSPASSIRSSIRRSSCSPSSKNCALMNQTNKQCLYCYENYLLWNGECIKQISFCVEYAGQGRCIRCQSDKLLVENSTGSRCFGLPDHCTQINNLGRCTSCQPSYILFQDECVIYQKNCKKYDKTGRCLSCIQPFLLQNGQCTTQPVCLFPPEAKPSQCKKCRAPLHQIDGYCIEKDEYCKQYKNEKCVTCLGSFHMMEQKCIANPKHCLLFNSQAEKCVNCESGFIVIGGVCEDFNVRFFACREIKGDICVQCQYGFKLTNNTCNPTTCLTQTPTRSCLTCPPYYKKHLTSSSTICIPHFCQSSSFQKFIHSTSSPINLNNCPFRNEYQGGLHCHSSGRISIQYCIKYDQESLKCTMCETGWGVRDRDQFGVCVVNGCLKEEVRCKGCKEGYELMQDSTCNIKYCLIFNQQTHTCTTCQPSHILSESSTCIPKHCKNQKNSDCLQCKQGYKNNNGKCQVQSCLQVNKNQECISCDIGYELDAKTGLCSKKIIRYCLQQFNELCKRCQQGFHITSQGYCARTNCVQDSFKKCLQCQDGYYLNSQNNGICEPVNCKNMSANNLCDTCLEGYYMSESKICKPQKCRILNQGYKCQQCKKGYQINLQGLCQLNLASLSCPQFSFNNSSSEKCQKVSVPNCKTAINVQTNYKHKDNIQQCVECIDGYYLSNGSCYLMEGCLMTNAEEGCWSCQKGWVLRDRLCFKDRCQRWVAGICQVCQQGYLITADRKSCSMKVYNCEKQDKYGRCIKCPQGFEPMQYYKGCTARNCKKLDPSSQTCLQCQNPYILTPSNSCMMPPTPNITNCLYYQQNQCRKCNQGYSNFKNKCVKYEQGCQIRDHDGICLFCKYGFALLQHRCISDHSNCVLKEDNGYGCRFCKKGFHVRVDGVCYQNQQFCQVEGLRGVCEKCVEGYDLDQQNICVPKTEEQQSSPSQTQPKHPYGQPETQYSSPNAEEPIQKYMQNCLIKDDIHQACIMCEGDYYTTEQGYCQPIPQHCQFIDMHGVCFQCDPGYHLINNKCIKETDKGKNNNNKTGKINQIMGNNQGNLRSGKF